MNLSVGSFRSQSDRDLKFKKYNELLDLQSKLARTLEEKNKEVYRAQAIPLELQPTSTPRYTSTEDELKDINAQQQIMLQTLSRIFKYPAESRATLDQFLENGYDPRDFNQLSGEFLDQIKNIKYGLTPSFFIRNWDRFITAFQSKNDTLINIGLQDDRDSAQVRSILNAIYNRFIRPNFTPEQSVRVREILDRTPTKQVDKPTSEIVDSMIREYMDTDLKNSQQVEDLRDSIVEKGKELESMAGTPGVTPKFPENVPTKSVVDLKKEFSTAFGKYKVSDIEKIHRDFLTKAPPEEQKEISQGSQDIIASLEEQDGISWKRMTTPERVKYVSTVVGSDLSGIRIKPLEFVLGFLTTGRTLYPPKKTKK